MPYYSGTATSASDLKTAIKNACIAEGWANPATDMLSKGDVFVELDSAWNPYTYGVDGLSVQAGTGESSSGSLDNPSPNPTGMLGAGTLGLFSFPGTYYIFINTDPDEVTVAFNYATLYWQWLGFGQSTKMGITGTGVHCWGSATANASIGTSHALYIWPLFYGAAAYSSDMGSMIDCDLDGQQWRGVYTTTTYEASSKDSIDVLKAYQPNNWNDEALLMRTWIYALRASGFKSYIAEIPHTRFIRNTFINDATVITLGSEQWFVAPIIKKDLDQPGGGVYTKQHSGTFGFAVRKAA